MRALFFDRSQLGDLLVRAYSDLMIGENAQVFGAIFRRLADPDNLPALIRCTAGKDRTGVAIALLLIALGVPEDTVVADYSLSNLYFQDFQAFARQAIRPLGVFGVTIQDLQPLFLAAPDTLRRCLETVRSRYGSVHAYLRDYAGVDDATLKRVRANLIE
jgi:protein-tyrosine phosphatase